MTSGEAVHPLRLPKSSNSMSSPTKMAGSIPRPLSEISPMEKRRNSPSWNQTTKKMTTTDSSPFQSSPLDGTSSPRLFWQNKFHSENAPYAGRAGSPSPTRRPSVERLQKASRVKNSNILALEHRQEYDPTRVPQVERPLAKVQGNAYAGNGGDGMHSPTRGLGHARNGSKTSVPLYSPSKPNMALPFAGAGQAQSPTKEPSSPIKSSLSTSRFKSSFDPETGTWSADTSADERELPDGKMLQRHAKSVTFDAAPPQVNEYEMATPDLSSVGSNSRQGSYDSVADEDDEYDEHFVRREGDGLEDSFDASLEDTDKTPVVGPDDWRQDGHDEVFEQGPLSEEAPMPSRPQQNGRDSANSNGDHRPLPPLPGGLQLTGLHHSNASSTGLSATAERMLGSHRSLPSPPPAYNTKSEMQNVGNGMMTLEERLKLMMLSDDGKTAAEQQRERRLRRATGRDRTDSQTPERDVQSPDAQSPVVGREEGLEEDDTVGEFSGLDMDYQLPPRISRESILRRVNGSQGAERQSDYNFSSPPPESLPGRQLHYDPDVPISSIEESIVEEEEEEEEDVGSVIVKREPINKDVDVYDIADIYQREDDDDDDDVGSVATHDKDAGEDDESHYSDSESVKADGHEGEEDPATTPRATPRATPTQQPALLFAEAASFRLSPRTTTDGNFSRDLESYMTAEGPEKSSKPATMADVRAYLQRPQTPERQLTRSLSKPEYDGTGWGDPEEDFDEPGTPDSVIHHPVSDDVGDDEVMDSPVIPERVATIKSASGSKLKTRASATPSDLMAMREARRHVSREVPSIPPIPERPRDGNSRDMEESRPAAAPAAPATGIDDFIERHPSFKKRSLTLDLDLGLSLGQDLERVMEAQKVAFQQSAPTPLPRQTIDGASRPSPTLTRQASGSKEMTAAATRAQTLDTNVTSRKQRGYLMRQNTKLVAASDKDCEDFRSCRSAGNSPIKQTRPQSWTVEPWNGAPRKRSTRKRVGVPTGPVPPMPGLESNAAPAAPNPMADEDMASEMATEESGERGRLFVKVMGVKDLDLPLPKNERTWFSLTLDNGVHCVTTAWLELARNAPIGQEFELVVPNDLEFQLTLNVKLERPAPKKIVPSPTKISRPKASTFSRVFASPKKRKEMELRQREEDERLAQQQREAQARQLNTQPTGWDLLSPLAAEDGSFARAYVCLKEHEARCFGRPYLVDVAAFNEWATEEAGFASSVKSKRGNTTVVRRAPYKVGKLELQLLFVPRPKGVTDDDMPKSMNSCIREMKAAEERSSRNWEGHLSQQGGDCPYWRRRYFKLVGTKLTAYHESTRQPRATINLANAKRLIDDRQALMEKETTGKGGRRRRSAFAEEEEGYMFVEEGFRIRFNNGEVIDFYADSTQEKDGWMKILNEVIGRDSIGSIGPDDETSGHPRSKTKWCELVLKKEEALRRRHEGRRVHSRTKSMYM